MIEINGLRKQFGDLVAVDDVSFQVKGGEIFGFLGPNGAGKSTTINCLAGLLRPTSGSVRILGIDVVTDGPESRRQLGVVPQELALYEELSAAENISYWGAAYGLRGDELKHRVNDALNLIGLLDRAKEPCKNFSGGMKRRLNFGCGIVHSPRVLLLDEPTVGVDPQSREKLNEMVREQVDNGTCVLYTTHYMEEAETLCDRLAIIDHGKIIAAGTLRELQGIMGERDILRLTGVFDPERVNAAFATEQDVELLQSDPEVLQISVADASQYLSRAFVLLQGTGAEIKLTTIAKPSLENLFLKLTGTELRE